LNWSGLYLQKAPTSGADTGIDSSVVSLPGVAVQQFARQAIHISAPSGTFEFNSAYFAGVLYDNLFIEVGGYKLGTSLNGAPDYSASFFVNMTAPTLQIFNWLDVADVRINACCGSKHFSYFGNEADNFLMDNLRVNASSEQTSVPEPSTIALIAMALLSLFGLCMMRRRAEA
jgi:hypothetical protein